MNSYIDSAKKNTNLSDQLHLYFNLVNKNSLTGSAKYEVHREIVNLLKHLSNNDH